jgi:putative FmdB family regulatory protein
VPTYEYACTECGHRLEAVQKFTDEPLSECPECGAPLRKVYGAVGIVLKGSGFYKTDSRAAAAAGSGSNGKSATDGEKTKGGDPASNGGSTPSGESASGSGTGSDSSKKEKSPDAKPAASTSS